MISPEEIETRAMEIYDGWNWSTGIPWVRRNEPLKQRYREIARDQLIEAMAVKTGEDA
jgi:hypothetical protein